MVCCASRYNRPGLSIRVLTPSTGLSDSGFRFFWPQSLQMLASLGWKVDRLLLMRADPTPTPAMVADYLCFTDSSTLLWMVSYSGHLRLFSECLGLYYLQFVLSRRNSLVQYSYSGFKGFACLFVVHPPLLPGGTHVPSLRWINEQSNSGRVDAHFYVT